MVESRSRRFAPLLRKRRSKPRIAGLPSRIWRARPPRSRRRSPKSWPDILEFGRQLRSKTVIACDKREAFAQGIQRVARMRAPRRAQLRSRSDDRLRDEASFCLARMDCFRLRSLSFGGQVATLAMTKNNKQKSGGT